MAQGDLPLLDDLDFDAIPDAFMRSEEISLKFGGTRYRVKLKTSGWEDATRLWKRDNPKPMAPYTEKKVPEGSDLAEKLGHTRGLAMVKVYDEADAEYGEKLEEWAYRHNLVICADSLQMKLRDDGRELTEASERADALRKHGMTRSQAHNLAQVIVECSVMEVREITSFFDDASEGGESG